MTNAEQAQRIIDSTSLEKAVDRITAALDAKDATITALRAERDGLRAEVVRLRHGLNQVAWPGQYGINAEQATADMFRHIAQDTLAISTPVANARVSARAALAAGQAGAEPSGNPG